VTGGNGEKEEKIIMDGRLKEEGKNE